LKALYCDVAAIVNGDAGTVSCSTVTITGDVNGDVKARGNVTIYGDANGDVEAGGNVSAKLINGDLNASGSIVMSGDVSIHQKE
jgi:septum formation inhibitor MinC